MNFDVETLFAGGRLCLDFINTSCERRGVKLEFLGNAEELRQWLCSAEAVGKKQLCGADEVWSAEYGEDMLSRAIELRNALRDLVLGVIEGNSASPAAIETVNAVLRENPACLQIGQGHDGFQGSTLMSHPDNGWLAQIAQDAVDLLCHSDLSLLRQCECPSCVRVFYDSTKNHKRRWCVEKCGSRPKAAAYYRRKVVRAAQVNQERALRANRES